MGVWGVINNYPSITGLEKISPNLIFGAGPYNDKNLFKSSNFPIYAPCSTLTDTLVNIPLNPIFLGLVLSPYATPPN